MAKPITVYRDPSIDPCAARLLLDAQREISALRMQGYPFHMARTKFLEDNTGQWVKLYGKECADVAVQTIMMTGPWFFVMPEHQAALAKAGQETEDPNRPPRIGWAMAAAILLGLLLAFGWLPGVTPAKSAEERERRAHLAACADAKTEPERRRLNCWRFDGAERNTFRTYDRDAPRDWEKPRSWEVR